MAAWAGMTTSPTGGRRNADARARGFTLIELILVMALLAVVLAVAAPTLARFFTGRTLGSEAKRLLALTRYGQSAAISRGVPMELWLSVAEGAYGLRPAPGYDFSYGKSPQQPGGMARVTEERALEFRLPKELQFELERGAAQGPNEVSCIRFAPDGAIDEISLRTVTLRQNDQEPVRLSQTDDRLSYEIESGTAGR